MKAILAALVLVMLAAPASAHKLKLFASVEGGDIVGSVYFVGGDKAVGVPGRIQGGDGALVVTFTTGPDGSFRQSVTARTDHIVSVESEDGHAAQFTIRAAELPPTLPEGKVMAAAPDSAALEAAIARQIRPLREQLDAYESRVRLHDIMGGIGSIFGLFGCWAWLQSRRRSG
jgi:nickel transport protein